MDIKDSYLHGTVGVVKSISVNADKLTYTLADKQGTQVKVTLPQATVTTNGVMSNSDKVKLDNLNIDYFSNIVSYKISLPDNSGRDAYILIAKLTNWVDGKGSDYGFIGRIVGYRGGNQLNTCCYNLVAMLSSYVYNNATTYVKQLYVDKHTGYLEALPYVVTYNGENYLALKKLGSGTEIYFEGVVKNVLPQSQWIVLNTPSGKSLPDNMTVLHSPNFTDAHSITTSKYFDGSSTKTLLHSGNYTNYVNTTNFPGLNKTGTVTSVTLNAGGGISIDNTAAITSTGTRTITNTGVRAISTGTTNGTISVNTNGTSANVAVKGLGSAAYTNTSLYQKQSTYVNNTGEVDVYKKITITKSDLDGYGVWLHSRKQHYLLNSGAAAMSTPMNTFWELGTAYNASSEMRIISVKMIAPASSSNITLYVLVRAYTYIQVVTSGTVTISDSTSAEYESITSSTTGWVACSTAKWTDTTYSVVSNSANGLAPKVINTNTATVGSAYYVLASTNGSATPSWYKLPSNAFVNDDTKVTQTNTTTSASYRVLLSGNANDTTETTTARKSTNLLFNPSTGNLLTTYVLAKGLKGIAGSLEGLMNAGLALTYNRLSASSFSNETGITAKDNANGVLWVGTHDSEAGNTSGIGYGHMLGFVGSDGALYHKVVTNGNTSGSWKRIAYTTSDITGNAASADKLKTKRKLWGLDFDGSADVSGNMTGVGVINGIFKVTSVQNIAQLNVSEGSSDINYSHLYVSSNNTSYPNTRPLVLQYGYGNVGIGIIAPSEKLEVVGNVKATSFVGNLDGTYVNKLTGYSKATAVGSIAATDSLNTALGKLEYKADSAYELVKGAYDGDGTIENLAEILKVLEGIKDTETIQAIIGKYLPLTGGTLTGKLTIEEGNFGSLIVYRKGSTNSASIQFKNGSNVSLGYLGMNTANGNLFRFSADSSTSYKIWDSGIDGSGSGLDADLLDGTHKADLFTTLSNVNTTTNPRSIAVTVGGTSKYLQVAHSNNTLNLNAERFDTGAPNPTTYNGLTFQFSYNIDSDWSNVVTMRSYTDPKYCAAQIITPANNPGADTGYSGNMKWRLGRNTTWLNWRTVLDSDNYTTWINTTNFPGLDKTGTVTSIKVGSTSYSPSSGVVSLPAYPTSLKSPNAIKFKNTAGTEVSYDGSAAVDLTGGVNYATESYKLKPQSHDNVNGCYEDQKLRYFTLSGCSDTTSTNGKRYAGTANSYGFPVSNNANAMLWVGSHSGNYGHLLGFSSDGRIYNRYISNGSFATTVNGGSWYKIAFTSDIPTKTSQLTNDSGFLTSRGYIGTTAVQASSASQNLTGIANATLTGDLTLYNASNGNTPAVIFLRGTTTDAPIDWKIFNNSGGNLLILGNTASTGFVNVFRFEHPSYGNQVLSSVKIVPETNNTISLGTSSLKWSNVYATTFTGNLAGNATTASSAAKWTTARTLTIGNSAKTVDGSANVTWGLHDILYDSSTYVGATTSWNTLTTPGVYGSSTESTFTGDGNPESANGGLTPYRYGQVIVSRAGNTGMAQFYISHNDSSGGDGASAYGIKFRTGWNNTYLNTWNTILDSSNYTSYTVKKNGTGASGTWGINITGNAATATTLKPTTVVSAKAFSLINTTWLDTGYTFASLATGTYAVQVTSGTNLVASGIMSVYKNLSDSIGDEIPLHVYGTTVWRPYLRTYQNKLLISSNDASATSRTVTIKIAQIL